MMPNKYIVIYVIKFLRAKINSSVIFYSKNNLNRLKKEIKKNNNIIRIIVKPIQKINTYIYLKCRNNFKKIILFPGR